MSPELYAFLVRSGGKGETFDAIIRRLLKFKGASS